MVTGEPPYDWISLQQAAKRLGIYHQTLRKRIKRGDVPAYRIGPKLIRLRVHELDGKPSPPPPVRVEPTDRILDTDSAAAYLGLGQNLFRTIVRRGEIPHSWRSRPVD